MDCWFLGQLEDKAHDTLPLFIVRDPKSKGIWSHPVPLKGVTHPYLARPTLISKSEKESSWSRSGAEYCCLLWRCQEWLARWSCARSISQGREQEQWRGRACGPICTRTCEDPQRFVETAIWKRSGIPKSVVSLVGGALFQSSPTLPQRWNSRPSHCLHAFERQALESWDSELWWVRWFPKAHTTLFWVEMVKRCVRGFQSLINWAHCHGRDRDVRCAICETSRKSALMTCCHEG